MEGVVERGREFRRARRSRLIGVSDSGPGDSTAADAMPIVFIGHGSPMNTIEDNRFTRAWADLAAGLPTPRAIVAVSAHWYTNATAVTAMARPRTIHDFFGFPDELFSFDYPCPGSADVAAMVADAVAPRWVGLDQDSWGIDHGTWSVLAHMYPEADIPVVQLSLNGLQPLDYHLDIGSRLGPVRDEGVLIVASGNVVHNLGLMDGSRPEGGFAWAERFDEAARAQVLSDPGEVLRLADHRDFALAVPTPDHFLPLVYFAALAGTVGLQASVVTEGYAFGSLSMTSYRAG